MPTFTKYIANEDHYTEVISRIATVRETLWIGTAYIGSANLTGAGIGMKSSLRRNFEAGILTNDPQIVEAAIEQFDTLWMGAHCQKCGRQEFCGDRIK